VRGNRGSGLGISMRMNLSTIERGSERKGKERKGSESWRGGDCGEGGEVDGSEWEDPNHVVEVTCEHLKCK